MKTEMKAAMILAIATIFAAIIGLSYNNPSQIIDNSIANSVNNIDLSKHSSNSSVVSSNKSIYNIVNSKIESESNTNKNPSSEGSASQADSYENDSNEKNSDYKTITVLAQTLNNENYDVRYEAYKTIVKYGSAAVDPLIQVLESGNNYGKEYAARSLGEINDPRAIKPLAQALNNEDYDARYEAYKAIVKYGSAAVDPLTQIMESGNDYGKEYAAKALGDLKT